MPRRYKRKVEGLDPERGNDMYIFSDKFALIRELPREQAYAVICAFIDWLLGDDEASIRKKITDPAAKIILRMIVADAKKRVGKYIDNCNKSIPKKFRHKNKERRGERGLTRVNHKDKDMLLQEELLRPSSCKSADARKVAVADADATAFADTAGRRDAPPEKPKTNKAILDALGIEE